jgi:hypothetical protein
MNITQMIIDRAVKIATKCALSGKPVSKIEWVPSTSATQDPIGNFIIVDQDYSSATET